MSHLIMVVDLPPRRRSPRLIMAVLATALATFAIVAACGDEGGSSFGVVRDGAPSQDQGDPFGWSEPPPWNPQPDPIAPDASWPFRACGMDAGEDVDAADASDADAEVALDVGATACGAPAPTCLDDGGFGDQGRWLVHFENGRCFDGACVWDMQTTYCRVACYRSTHTSLDGAVLDQLNCFQAVGR